MKRKFLLIALAFVFALSCAVGLAACKDNCDHRFNIKYDNYYHWQECEYCSDTAHTEEHNTFGANGECSVCHYKKSSSDDPSGSHTHAWEETLSYDETYHWYACTVDGCVEKGDKSIHSFKSGKCDCGYTQSGSVDPDEGDETFTDVTLSESGVLNWNKIKGASKYVLKITYAAQSNPIEHTIDKNKNSVDLNGLSGEDFPVGKSTAELLVYENEKVEIDGKTFYQEVLMTDVKESFRIVKSNGIYSLTKLTFSDSNIKLDGFYAEKQTIDGKSVYLYEQVLKNNNPMTFRIKNYVKAADSEHTVYFYKSDAGRKSGDASDLWNSSELQMGYPQVRHGANFYYVKTVDNSSGQETDYDLCVYGLYTLTIKRFATAFTQTDGLRNYTHTPIGNELYYTEMDIIPQEVLYGGVEDGKLSRTPNYKIIEKEDFIILSDSPEVTYYFYDEETLRSDCSMYEQWSKIYDLSEYADGWSLSCNYDKAAGMIYLPNIIIGKKVVSANFFYSSVSALIVEDGAETLTATFTDCWNLLDIFLPASITYMQKNSFKGVNSNVVVHCAFKRSDANNFTLYWDYDVNKKVSTEFGVSVPEGALTISNGLVLKKGEADDELAIATALESFDGVIPDTVLFEGTTYKLTEIVSLGNCTNVTIGRNIRSIADGALKNMQSVSVKNGNLHLSVEDGILYSDNGTHVVFVTDKTLTEYVLKESVTKIDFGVFFGCDAIESLSVPFVGYSLNDTIKSHFGYIFGAEDCIQNQDYVPYTLKKVTVSGNAKIADQAFYDCYEIVCIVLSDGVSEIGSNAFYGCNALSSVTVGQDSAYFASQDGVLYNKNLTKIVFVPASISGKIVIPQGITTIGEEFADCRSVTEIEIHKDVTEISASAFANCTLLQKITVAEENSIYSSVDGILYDNAKTTLIYSPMEVRGSVSIPQGITAIPNEAFKYRYGITEITIPDGVQQIGKNAFEGCNNIVTATIPSIAISFIPNEKFKNVTITSGSTIGSKAFNNCTMLESVIIADSIKEVSRGAFDGCFRLGSVENGIKYVDKWAIYGGTNEYVTLREDTVGIADGAFMKSETIKEITIPESVKYLGQDVFRQCSKLRKVTFLGNNISEIRYASFIVCSALTEINLPTGIETIGESAFDSCTNLSSMTIPDGVTTICRRAFYNCNTMSSVFIPQSVKKIESEAFRSCNKLENIYIENLSAWCNIDFADYAANPMNFFTTDYVNRLYLNNTLVTDLVIPSSAKQINKYAFAYCSSIRTVTVEEGVTDVGASAFTFCGSLTEVRLPSTLQTIENNSFGSCYELTTLVLTNGLKSIGDNAFSGDKKLSAVYFNGTENEWNAIEISNTDGSRYLLNATRYYYSQTQPTDSGNYWHYDTDGVTILKW